MIHKLVVPFKREHYDWLTAAQAAEGSLPRLPNGMLEQLEGCNSWTGVVDGDVVMCGGTIEQWPGRHIAWAYLALSTKPHMGWITRETRKRIALAKGRVEFTVRLDFPAGRRWAHLLGFRMETPYLAAYGPGGEPHAGYVRIN